MEASTIGLDLAKNVFQILGVDASGRIVIRKAIRRSQVLPLFAKLSPCLVGIEACGTSYQSFSTPRSHGRLQCDRIRRASASSPETMSS
jgi:transposase